MSQLAPNLCFLLWQRQVPRADWVGVVAEWVQCNRERSHDLLRGVDPSSVEVGQIALAVAMEEQELFYGNLLEQSGIDVWQENVAYLVGTLKHGEQSKLVEFLGLRSSGTVTKWKKKEVRPELTHKDGLRDFFGVSLGKDLERDPLFLSLMPMEVASQRAWLHERIDQVGDRTLQQLFPALERLLRDP